MPYNVTVPPARGEIASYVYTVDKNWPAGRWYITAFGHRFEGEITGMTNDPINCGVDLWSMEVYDGSKQVEITAPRTCFRKVKE